MRVIDRGDADDIAFTHFAEKTRHYFIEFVMADLHTIGPSDSLGADFLIRFFGGDLERSEWFGDEPLGGFVARHLKMHLHFGGCGGGDSIHGMPFNARAGWFRGNSTAPDRGFGFRDYDGLAARGALDFTADARTIDR